MLAERYHALPEAIEEADMRLMSRAAVGVNAWNALLARERAKDSGDPEFGNRITKGERDLLKSIDDALGHMAGGFKPDDA